MGMYHIPIGCCNAGIPSDPEICQPFSHPLSNTSSSALACDKLVVLTYFQVSQESILHLRRLASSDFDFGQVQCIPVQPLAAAQGADAR